MYSADWSDAHKTINEVCILQTGLLLMKISIKSVYSADWFVAHENINKVCILQTGLLLMKISIKCVFCRLVCCS